MQRISSVYGGAVLRRNKTLNLGFPALVSQGSLAVWGIISILIARQLPDDAYAAYALARSIEMFAGLLGGGFVLQALLKLGSEKPSRETSQAANAASLLTLGFSLFAGAMLLVFRGALNSFYSDIDLNGIIPAIVLASVTGALAFIPRNLLLTRLGTGKVMQADLVSLSVRGGIVGWLIFSGKLTGAVQVLHATALANTAALLISGWNARHYFEPGAGLSRRALRRVSGFALFSLGTSLAGFVYTRTDILMLGKLAPPGDVAAYGASRALTSMVVMVSAAANMVLMPVISRAWSENRRSDLLKKTMKALLFVQLIQLPVVTVLVLFPKWVIDAVYQGRYADYWPILAILGGLSLIRPFGSLFSTAGSAMGKPQYSFWSVLISAVVNVGLNIVLIPKMGGQGAAWATAAAVFAGAIAVVILTLKRWRRGTGDN